MKVRTKLSSFATPEEVRLIRSGRKVGNTTRIVDNIIQLLFEGNIVKVADHHDSANMGIYVMKRVIERLYREHNITDMSLTIDKDKRTIGLKEELLNLLY